MTQRQTIRTTLLLTAMLLASCGDGEATDTGRNNATAATQAPPTPVPTPPVMAELPGIAPLTAIGWGPLRIGMSLDEVTAALGPDADPGAVGGPDPETCDQFRPQRAPRDMLVMIENGRLSRVSLVRGTDIATDRGVGLGDDAASVRAAYGAAIEAEAHAYTHPEGGYLTAWARGGDANVRDSDARGIRYEIGGDDRVTTIHAGGPSIENVEGCL